MQNFLGRDGFIWFTGVIEDRDDPDKLGRVRVRCVGYHTDDVEKIPTADLPWSWVMMPTTTSAMGGLGEGMPFIVEGSWVVGFFRDPDTLQEPIIMGSLPGVPEQLGDPNKGFNDPRRNTQTDYDGTNDGLNPPSAPQRPNSLSIALDKSPHLLKDAGIKYDGTGSVRTESTEAEKTLPYYPLVKDATDINVFTTGDAKYDSRDMSKYITNAKSNATPLYPFNKALYTESGHIVELDDTRDNERISIEHRTGTFYEIDKDGNEIHRVVNDNYTVICKDNELYVGGKVNIKVLGDATVNVDGETKVHSKKKMTLSSGNEVEVVAPIVSINGAEVKLNS